MTSYSYTILFTLYKQPNIWLPCTRQCDNVTTLYKDKQVCLLFVYVQDELLRGENVVANQRMCLQTFHHMELSCNNGKVSFQGREEELYGAPPICWIIDATEVKWLYWRDDVVIYEGLRHRWEYLQHQGRRQRNYKGIFYGRVGIYTCIYVI